MYAIDNDREDIVRELMNGSAVSHVMSLLRLGL